MNHEEFKDWLQKQIEFGQKYIASIPKDENPIAGVHEMGRIDAFNDVLFEFEKLLPPSHSLS